MRSAAVVLALSMLSGAAFAAPRTETLHISHMTCESCPYILRDTLLAVPGVSAAAVSFVDKTATVTFADARTDVAALTRATAAAGYPSEVVK